MDEKGNKIEEQKKLSRGEMERKYNIKFATAEDFKALANFVPKCNQCGETINERNEQDSCSWSYSGMCYVCGSDDDGDYGDYYDDDDDDDLI